MNYDNRCTEETSNVELEFQMQGKVFIAGKGTIQTTYEAYAFPNFTASMSFRLLFN
jgi:hypothetical protein